MSGRGNLPAASGWYQVLWSGELAPGDVRALRYFGQDLVAYRGMSGRAAVLDAHCPHLGAHLGIGGAVDGDCIQCPFHGWVWDEEGRNVRVPYSSREKMAVRARRWPVHEVNGFVLVWYDAMGREPWWYVPELPEFAGGDYYDLWPRGCDRYERQRLHPQWPIENIVDVAHFKYVHRSPEPAVLELVEEDGPLFHTRFRQKIGREGSPWTPGGPIDGWVDCQAWGVGFLVNRLSGLYDTVQIETATPVDDEYADICSSIIVRRQPGCDEPEGIAEALYRIQREQLELDLPIWSNLRYVDRPPFVPEEAKAYMALRRWAASLVPTDGEVGAR